MSNRNSEEGSDYDIRPEDICPAGGIHDYQRKWLFSDYISACYCCPCYCLRELCCGWLYRNPTSDDFDCIGCRPTGEKRCLKCKQTENQAKMSVALENYEQPSSTNTQDTNPSNVPSMPQPPAYAQTREEKRK
ncbi:8156_t:CDS:2 [Paraglomus brasilianum]|uniref:8156_t:CDS:1 n=1 Tax=Paraglomus brasilianum TaxID=144538 RepID=A0A9N9G7M8_9GLOM|nr:8156_t:CDS:2 [Paraglomus brasilianum]